MTQTSGKTENPPTRSREPLLWFLLVLVVLVVPLAVMEFAVRALGVRVSDDPFLQFGKVDSFFERRDIDGVPHYQVMARDVYRERETSFPVTKAPGVFRIFCLGGSASAGWPHPAQEIYSAYLEEALQRAYPTHRIDVINVSAHAYAAYRTRLIFEEVIEFSPDLFIIYAGNNEFIEDRRYGTNEHWYDALIDVANYSAVFRLSRGSPWARTWFPENTLRAEERGQTSYEQWSKLEQISLELRRDSQQFARVREHYEYSIEAMVKKARDRNVPVVLVTVPVNLRDWEPNVSYQALSGSELDRWREAYWRGRSALLRNDVDAAVWALEAAAAMAPLHAETHFFLGKALEAQGSLDAAIAAFNHARDVDHNPFRAITAFNETLRNISRRNDGTMLADADIAFQAGSYPHAPGFDYFLDYVHPTKIGNLLIAKSVFDLLVESNIVGPEDPASLFVHEPAHFHDDGSPYDEKRDIELQAIIMHLLIMMNQYDTIVAKATQFTADPVAMAKWPEWQLGEVGNALEIYPQLISLRDREFLTGEADAAERAKLREQLRDFHRTYFSGYEQFKVDGLAAVPQE